jgi:uncharacterized protein (DUF2237 family)
MSSSGFKSKTAVATLILLLVLPTLAVFNVIPVHAVVKDLTPDYAKKGATVDILSFNIVGPTGGTTLYSVTIEYTGTSLGDISYAAVYVDGTLFGLVYRTAFDPTTKTATVTGSYVIGEGVSATVKLVFKLSTTALENNMVDGKIVDYLLSVEGAAGTDLPPIDPAGYTTIDNTSPEVTLTAPLDGEYITTNICTVTATASDALSGVASVSFYYSIDGGETWVQIGTDTESPYEVTWDLTAITDQTDIQVKAVAVDNAGNTAEDINTGITLDRTRPTITDLTPTGSIVDTAPLISAKLLDVTSGINPDTIMMELDNNLVTHTYDPVTGVVSYQVPDTAPLDEGSHTVYVYVEDNAGNPAEATWSFIVDITPPTISNLTPAPEAYVNTVTPTISATLADAFSGINPDTIMMELDNNLVTHTYDPVTGVVSYQVPDTAPLDEGSHTVYVYVEDNAGNPAEETWTFTVAVAVSVTLTAPLDGAYITTNTYTVTATASSVAGVASVSFYYSLDGGETWELIGTDIESPYEVEWDLSDLSDQTGIQVKAVAVDNAGNEAYDINTGITLDRVPPTAPTDLTATATPGAIVLSWTASEDVTSGVKLYKIYRGTTSGGPYTVIGTVNHPTTTYTDTTVGPVAGITYYYIVRAVDFAGLESDPSNEASATTVPGVVASVTVTAQPTKVQADGIHYSTITAIVKDEWGNVIPGVTVYFTTTLGTLSATSAITNESGVATVTLTSTTRGTAIVTATADSISDTVEVEFYGAAGIEDVIAMLEEIEGKLDGTIESLITTINSKLGTFTGTDNVASLLYDIEDKLDALPSYIDSAKADIIAAMPTLDLTPVLTAIDSAKADIIAAMPTLDLTPVLTAIDSAKADIIAAMPTLDLTPVLTAIQSNSTAIVDAINAIEVKLDNETYGLVAIKNAVSGLSVKLSSAVDTITGAVGDAEASILAAISDVETKLDKALPALMDAVSKLEVKLDLLVVDADGSGVPDFIEEIDAIEAKLDEALPKLDAIKGVVDAIKLKTDTINWADITAIKGVVDAIKLKTDTINWADITYIKNKLDTLMATPVAQATSGSGSAIFTSSGTLVIYKGSKVGTVTVSLKTSGVGYGESLVIRYYTDPSNPTVYIEKTVTSGKDTPGWTDTAAAWKVEIVYTWRSGTDTVYWGYSAIYPP